MQCSGCGYSHPAVNQHTACPKCGKVVGIADQSELDETLARVIGWFEDWEESTRNAREESERDRDYYDGMQWTSAEISDLNDRNQPVIVKNRIFKKINYLLGMEVKNRADPKALPRTPAHDDDVIAITDALRYVVDSEDFDRISSAAWGNELVEGYGGAVVEHEIVGDIEPLGGVAEIAPTSAGTKVDAVIAAKDNRSVEVRLRRVPWDRLWYDIHSREPDFSDANHKGISVWMDLEDALREYGKRKDRAENYDEVLEEALTQAGNSPTDTTHDDKPITVWTRSDGGRKRIRISECYYLKTDPETNKARWYTCHYTKSGFVVPPKPTGYVDEKGHDTCPLEMTSAFVTREGMRYGLVRHMIGPQDEINKRSSKALHQLSVDQTVAEEGAVLNPDEARIERAKPDGWITVQHGALSEGRIQFEKGLDRAQGQLQLLQEAKAEIDTIGPEIPQIGSVSTGASGRALMMRQQIGSLELAPLEDNHKRWKRAIYRQIWYRIRQFWPEEKWLRVRDDAERTGFRFVGLNRRMARGERFMELLKKEVPIESAAASVLGSQTPIILQQVTQGIHAQMQQLGPQAAQMPPEQQQQALMQALVQHPAMREPITANDVANLDVDVVLDESPDTSILQQEEYEQLSQLIPAFLQAQVPAQPLLELALEASQLRNKRRLLEMLRKPPDPQQMQMQQMMQQLQTAQAQAGLAVQQSQAQLNQAKAAQAAAEAQQVTPADVQLKQAQAMKAVADAGEKAGTVTPASSPPPPAVV